MPRKKRSEIFTKNVTNHGRSNLARKRKRLMALVEEVKKQNQTKKGENKQ
ncbi:hypothetical protein [Peribacillus asahii]|nr:hypothetical protein [Peribacillus asahii]USK84782.1 hypothetical protein LIT35_20725 [Peribacillus asahii]